MSYNRVLPRDLFNEANLLKCLAKLVLDIEDNKLPWLSYHHDGDPFNIEQNQSNGALSCTNLQFFAARKTLNFERPLNSRDAWPLMMETENDCYPVFDGAGHIVLTVEQCRK